MSSHAARGAGGGGDRRVICHFFARTGSCYYGARCRFTHSTGIPPQDDRPGLSWTDHFLGKPASLSLGADGNPLSPVQQRAQIERPLQLVKAALWFFAQGWPATGSKRHRRESLPLLGHMSAEYSACAPSRVMFGCVATACTRLTTAPRNMRVADGTTRCCAGWVMDRVARGHVRRVQVWLQRRASRLVRALARDNCEANAHCSSLWLIFGYAAPPNRPFH